MPGLVPGISLRRARPCPNNRDRRDEPGGDKSLQRRNDADVAHGAVAQGAQRFLVAGAVVAGDGLFKTGEFRDDDTFLQAGLRR